MMTRSAGILGKVMRRFLVLMQSALTALLMLSVAERGFADELSLELPDQRQTRIVELEQKVSTLQSQIEALQDSAGRNAGPDFVDSSDWPETYTLRTDHFTEQSVPIHGLCQRLSVLYQFSGASHCDTRSKRFRHQSRTLNLFRVRD